MQAEGGAAGFVDIVARLLGATFGGQRHASAPSLPASAASADRRDLTPAGVRGGARSPRPFPWDDVMAAGLGLLRLPPADFWSMTPRELEAALRGLLGPARRTHPCPAPRSPHLMTRFPD